MTENTHTHSDDMGGVQLEHNRNTGQKGRENKREKHNEPKKGERKNERQTTTISPPYTHTEGKRILEGTRRRTAGRGRWRKSGLLKRVPWR